MHYADLKQNFKQNNVKANAISLLDHIPHKTAPKIVQILLKQTHEIT